MQILRAMAVAVVLLAGCSSPQTDPGPAAAEPATLPAPLAFEAPLAVATIPNTGHESFLAISADGQTMLTCAHGDFREPVHKFASVDGGMTFAELDSGPGVPAGDCEVALSPDGQAWSFAEKTDAGIAVVTTTDGGRTWVGNALAGPPLNGLADRQWLAYVGTTLLLSYQPGSQETGSVYITRSQDLGVTWSLPAEVLRTDPQRPGLTVGDFAVGPGPQEVRVPVLRKSLVPPGEGPGDLSLLVSQDGGATWTEHVVGPATSEAYPTGLAVTSLGVLAWAYQEPGLDSGTLVLIVSADGGATWTDPVPIGDGTAWDRPWASARPDGTIDVAWLSDGSQFGRGPALAVTRIDPLAPQPVVASLPVADVDFIEFAAVAHDASGRATVVVIDAPSLIIQQEVGTQGTLLVVREAVPGGAAPTA